MSVIFQIFHKNKGNSRAIGRIFRDKLGNLRHFYPSYLSCKSLFRVYRQKIMNISLSLAKLFRVGFLAFAVLFSQMALSTEAKPKVHEFELDNGLKVLVKQDQRAPVAVLQVWYKVGTSYEHEGITGLSHALEHMMFKGTKKYKSGEFEKMVSAKLPL